LPPQPSAAIAEGAASVEGANNYLAYPGEGGQAFVYDVWHQKLIEVIKPEEAHNSPIACMAFSPNGDKLATACTMGTLILVFSTPGKQILFQCRRGQMPCTIFCMSFSADAAALCVSSDHASVHVFSLESAGGAAGAAGGAAASVGAAAATDGDAASGAGGGTEAGSYLGSLFSLGSGIMERGVSAMSSVLPTAVTDPMKGLRAFAKASLPNAGVPTICAISNKGDGAGGAAAGGLGERELLVVTYDGFLYRHTVPAGGGECIQTGFHALEKDHSMPAAPPVGAEEEGGTGGTGVDADAAAVGEEGAGAGAGAAVAAASADPGA
jgi:autophagy-related protein 18